MKSPRHTCIHFQVLYPHSLPCQERGGKKTKRMCRLFVLLFFFFFCRFFRFKTEEFFHLFVYVGVIFSSFPLSQSETHTHTHKKYTHVRTLIAYLVYMIKQKGKERETEKKKRETERHTKVCRGGQ